MAERKPYTCEFKMSVIQCFLEKGKIISSASRKFYVDRKRIREWLKKEESVVKQKRESRSSDSACTSRFDGTSIVQ